MLIVNDLSIKTADFNILRSVSFKITEGKVKVVVGESGAGKSTLGLFLAGILKPGLSWEGEVFYQGRKVHPLQEGWRGRIAGLVLQDPYSSFDPRRKILDSLIEPLMVNFSLSRREAEERSLFWLREVGFPEEKSMYYPHELSGGLLQRAAIAAALVLKPGVLVADEPTSALDPPLRAGIRELIKKFSEGRHVLYITHFMEDALFFGEDYLVLYGGMVMEEGPELLHPYSKLLLSSVIRPGKELPEVKGFSPHPSSLPQGCPFRPRCHMSTRQCYELPPLRKVGKNAVRCWNVP